MLQPLRSIATILISAFTPKTSVSDPQSALLIKVQVKPLRKWYTKTSYRIVQYKYNYKL